MEQPLWREMLGRLKLAVPVLLVIDLGTAFQHGPFWLIAAINAAVLSGPLIAVPIERWKRNLLGF